MIKVESMWTSVVECRPGLIPVEIGLKNKVVRAFTHKCVTSSCSSLILAWQDIGKNHSDSTGERKKHEMTLYLLVWTKINFLVVNISHIHFLLTLHCPFTKGLNGQYRYSLWTNRVGSQAGLVHEENRDKNLISGRISLRSRWDCWQMRDN